VAGRLSEPCDTYERLWREAGKAFDNGSVRLDPWLKNRSADQRRGITLVARPSPEVSARVQAFLQEIAVVAPDQHLYQPPELHMTVLSVIPGSEHWRKQAEKISEYRTALAETLAGRDGFGVKFRGVTASADAVMIQGFPADDRLEKLRDDLRAALGKRGLGETLDRRYKAVTAHLTVMRFMTALSDWKPLK